MTEPRLLFVLLCAALLMPAMAELPFLEPTAQEGSRMSPAERLVAGEKLKREWARQSEESTKVAEDQKSGICHVHRIKMDLKTIKIQYGMPAPTGEREIPRAQVPRLLAALAAEFPNADDHSMGGCVVMPDAPPTRDVYMCPRCVEAKRKILEKLRAAK